MKENMEKKMYNGEENTVSYTYKGTLGEILQGQYEGRDILCSCPINLYTEVTIKQFKTKKENEIYSTDNKKCKSFMKKLLKQWGKEAYEEKLSLSIKSSLPRGKGFASSTADICATYRCLIKLFNKEYREEELIANAIKIEPTDSIIFPKLTLFEYKTGNYIETLGDYPSLKLLVFEGNKEVDTVDFNNKNLPPLAEVDDLVVLLRQAVKEGDISLLAKVSTESIIRNQHRLKYSILEEVVKIKEETGGLGIIGAHSGDALALIYEKRRYIRWNLLRKN